MIHKLYDFTQPGGFPQTQDVLKRMQDSDAEAIKGMIAAGGNITGPLRVSGMEVTISGSDVTVTDGWFIYNGVFIPFTGSTVTLAGGQVALVEITTTSTPLTFNDGSTPNVVISRTGALINATTATTSTRFPVLNLKPWGKERDWTTVTSFASSLGGTVTGTLKYQKNTLANTLTLKGSLNVDCSSFVSALPAALYTKILTLPSGYRTASGVTFMANVASGGAVKTSDSVSWIRHVRMDIEAANGVLKIEVLKTLSDVDIDIEFDVIISLD